jgi:hypothetical protein
MVRGRKNPVGCRGSKGIERHNVRGSNDDPYNPFHPENDTCLDMGDHGENQTDPANDEYMWPEYEDEDEDRIP